jgi:hypothetical protein
VPATLIAPATSSKAPGVVVPIPTFVLLKSNVPDEAIVPVPANVMAVLVKPTVVLVGPDAPPPMMISPEVRALDEDKVVPLLK